MKRITVNTSTPYDVFVGHGLLKSLPDHLGTYPCDTIFAIISDENVWPLYGNLVHEVLTNRGYRVLCYTIPAGENSKTPEQYIAILNFLAENRITRSDILIALGGGVVGDLAGFAAATYMRGISYIQIPTTLLAMVDSSVGGKTAIDLASGKNLAGAFYQPTHVICDTDVLTTLSEDVFRDGCAEVIKYAVLFNCELFAHLENFDINFNREYVISTCISHKAHVVSDDEFDTGVRQKLNLGHTIGHSVEMLSSYTISHGQAVSIGMALIGSSAAKHQLAKTNDIIRINHLLELFRLPVNTSFSAEQLFEAALTDKKCTGKTINLVIPQEIGNCNILTFPLKQLKSFIEAGLYYGPDYLSQ